MRQLSLLVFLLATPAALADVQYDEAPVVDVEPIIERVRTVEPTERCWFERVHHSRRAERSATAPLLGAIIGAAVGNAVGHGKRNKQVGAVAGAVLGGSIAYDVSRREAHRTPTRQVRREVCDVVENVKYEERTSGYLVTYRYRGQTHRTRMATRPGETIRVRIHVSPA